MLRIHKKRINLRTDVTGSLIKIKLSGFHVIHVDDHQFLVDIINANASNISKIIFQLFQTITHCESEQSTAFVVEDISLVFIEHGSNEEAAFVVALGVIETNIIFVQFSQDTVDFDEMIDPIPVD